MALQARSLFLYNFSVNTTNQNIPFIGVSAGPQLNGVVPTGTYSLSTLATAIASALNSADPAHVYTVTVDRTVNSGQENRITIASSGTFFQLLFNSGTTAISSVRDLISFGHSDLTGATTYTNSSSSGIALITSFTGGGFNYQPPDVFKKNFGSINVATNGAKEAITWTIQSFIGVEFKYEAQAFVLANWSPLISWMIQQQPFDFTPQITSPTVFYPVTLESSSTDGQGLAFNMREMLPDFPFWYQTGLITMRVIGQG